MNNATKPPKPSFTKRGPASEPAPAKEKAAAARVEAPANDVWDPLTGEDLSETLSGICDTAVDVGFPEWELDAAKSKRIGDRWAKVANRWATRLKSPMALKALLYVTLGFVLIEVAVFFGGRAVKSVIRIRKERNDEKKTKVEHEAALSTDSNVTPIKPTKEGASA